MNISCYCSLAEFFAFLHKDWKGTLGLLSTMHKHSLKICTVVSFYFCEKNKPFVYIHSKFQSTARGFYGNIQYTYHSLILNQVRQGFSEMGLLASLPCSCLLGSSWITLRQRWTPCNLQKPVQNIFLACFASSISTLSEHTLEQLV